MCCGGASPQGPHRNKVSALKKEEKVGCFFLTFNFLNAPCWLLQGRGAAVTAQPQDAVAQPAGLCGAQARTQDLDGQLLCCVCLSPALSLRGGAGGDIISLKTLSLETLLIIACSEWEVARLHSDLKRKASFDWPDAPSLSGYWGSVNQVRGT